MSFSLKIAPSHEGSVPPSNTWFLGSTRLIPNGVLISSAVLHSSQQKVPILYSEMPLPPSKLPLPMGESGLACNTWFPGPTQVLNPNGISMGSAVFAGLTTVTNRQTEDRQTVGLICIRSTALQQRNNNSFTALCLGLPG